MARQAVLASGLMRPPLAELPAAGDCAGLLTPGCPVLPLGRAVFGRHGAFVYAAGARLWLLSRSAHTELAIFDLFCPRLNWPPRLWPAPRKGRLRGFDVKRAAAEMMAAVPARGLTAAARQYRRDRRGELAPFCPVAPFGVARIRGGGEATGVYDHACVYAVDGPAEGLYAIRDAARTAAAPSWACSPAPATPSGWSASGRCRRDGGTAGTRSGRRRPAGGLPPRHLRRAAAASLRQDRAVPQAAAASRRAAYSRSSSPRRCRGGCRSRQRARSARSPRSGRRCESRQRGCGRGRPCPSASRSRPAADRRQGCRCAARSGAARPGQACAARVRPAGAKQTV